MEEPWDQRQRRYTHERYKWEWAKDTVLAYQWKKAKKSHDNCYFNENPSAKSISVASESWTIKQADEKRIEVFEITGLW